MPPPEAAKLGVEWIADPEATGGRRPTYRMVTHVSARSCVFYSGGEIAPNLYVVKLLLKIPQPPLGQL